MVQDVPYVDVLVPGCWHVAQCEHGDKGCSLPAELIALPVAFREVQVLQREIAGLATYLGNLRWLASVQGCDSFGIVIVTEEARTRGDRWRPVYDLLG